MGEKICERDKINIIYSKCYKLLTTQASEYISSGLSGAAEHVDPGFDWDRLHFLPSKWYSPVFGI